MPDDYYDGLSLEALVLSAPIRRVLDKMGARTVADVFAHEPAVRKALGPAADHILDYFSSVAMKVHVQKSLVPEREWKAYRAASARRSAERAAEAESESRARQQVRDGTNMVEYYRDLYGKG